jgi:transcriptional regulator with GAF, ATPase, and Fis domain
VSQPDAPDQPPVELARTTEELRVLRRVSSEIVSTLSLQEIYRVSLQTMDELFGFHHSIILLLDESGEWLRVVASRGYEGQAIGGRVRVGTGVIGMVAKKRKPMNWNNVGRFRSYLSAQRRQLMEAGRADELGDFVPVPGVPNAESQIAIPLLVRDRLIGVFSVESPIRRVFDEHDAALVTVVANQTASAIETARLLSELQRANETLEARVRERTAELERELAVAREVRKDAKARLEGPLLGESPRVREWRDAIREHAAHDDTLLLHGPPGAGKEATARAIHEESARGKGPFLYVGCALLSGTDPSELLGSASAAAPGAAAGPGRGKFDLAHGGTIYLDAVGELPTALQRALLRVIVDLERTRVDGGRPNPDVRVIAGTARDLWEESRLSRFDADLCRLLARRRLVVPALAERIEDLPAIVEHLVARHSRTLGRNVERVSEESMRRLLAYRWPGNVRELGHVLERAVMGARGPVVEVEEELLEETISLGSYRLVERLGSGGMGEVWLGKHALLARPAAVKLIRPAALESHGPAVEDRFRREAQVTAHLTSPHTVQLYDFGVTETGTFYYVMERLRGLDLQEIVQRFGPLPPERVVALLDQVCLSLVEAHEHGLVHRDIKPANVFVTRLGPEYDFVKVLDFGMVKAPHDEDATRLTAAGTAQGTPAFISPELALGEEADSRSDLYSLGCVAYWLLTRRLLFEAANATRMMMHHVQTRPAPPSAVSEIEIPRELEAIVMRCLEKRPEDRPASAAVLREDLARVELREPWAQERAREWWRRHAPDALG